MSKAKFREPKEFQLIPLSISEFKKDILRYKENPASIDFMGEYINIDCNYDQFHIFQSDSMGLLVFLNWSISRPEISIREENIKKVFYSTHYYQLELKNGDLLHITFNENPYTEIGTYGKLILKDKKKDLHPQQA
jgi:hypothetical protein